MTPTVRSVTAFFVLILTGQMLIAQSRIQYNNQQLFLSGANLAWLNFANDIGPGTRDYSQFGGILVQLHSHGGNTLRWWLHTNGAVTPAFNEAGFVIGPGTGTITSLKKALDVAWQNEIGVVLCLWSFDMLRSTNGTKILERNLKLLSDTEYVRAYIQNCLIPMVDSLKGHPAIISWEVFNEPEGMSDEFFFYGSDPHVPMSAIQRFVNLCAGAIHRGDSTALVTNGAWSFKSLSNVSFTPLSKDEREQEQLDAGAKQQLITRFNEKYGYSFDPEMYDAFLRRIAALENYNYYSDSRLIVAGGDPKGTLDFYSVHYYDWGGTALSPLHHPSSTWQLDKPVVVAEFALKDTYGILKADIFKTLYLNGYAGALAWSWTDPAISQPADMLAGMQSLWDAYRSAVDVHGIGGDSVAVPESFVLRQNYPNPLFAAEGNRSTTIRFELPIKCRVSIKMFNLLGQEITEILNSVLEEGSYTAGWRPTVASGIYVCRMVAEPMSGASQNFQRSIKIVVLK